MLPDPPSHELAAARRPLDPEQVRARLGARPELVLEFVSETGSTNGDLLGRGDPGSSPVVRLAETQTAGRGRIDRAWSSPPGAGLTFSILLSDRGITADRLGWVGAILGLATVSALDGLLPGSAAGLKWPNDLLLRDRKCAGILAERVPGAVVVGIGLNVSTTRSELPRPDATSLLLAGFRVDRGALLAATLVGFARLVDDWRAVGGDVDAAGIRPAYLDRCLTLGRRVDISLPGGHRVSGTAVDVDAAGALWLADPSGERTGYAAGDVVHAALA